MSTHAQRLLHVSDTRGKSRQARGEATTPEDSHGLTDRQRLFVSAYLGPARGNATQAAIAAGYSEASAESQGSRLLSNAKVAAAVEQGLGRLLKRHDVTADRVIQELAHVAFLDVSELAGETGQLRDLAGMPEHVRRAVSSMDVDPAGVVKLRPADKLRALELLGKHLKLFTEKQELSGADGGPLQVSIAITRTVKEGA